MDPVTALGAGIASGIGRRIASRFFAARDANQSKPPPTSSNEFQSLMKLASESTAANATATNGSAAKAAESSNNNAAGSVGPVLENDLDKQAFLQLLVTQMQHQDPLDPVDNAQMIAQLAQFSALEQMTNLNTGFETLSGNIDQLNFLSASSMLGKTVSGLRPDGSLLTGTVEKIQMDGSVVYLTVNGELLSMAGVLSIEDAA